MKQKVLRTKDELRKELAVIDGKIAPTIVLKNGKYLNFTRRKWVQANIWIYGERIVYVGNKMPAKQSNTEIVHCDHSYIVPGYIEHHAHPFQLYNPLSLAKYASKRGTTTFINDNLFFYLRMSNEKAIALVEALNELPTTMYWWGRYDAQTEIADENVFSDEKVQRWLEHPLVIQGGELSGWPKVLAGNDRMLGQMQRTTALHKKIEGHLPGASERTLTKMALLGITCDHEAMTGEDVVKRLDLGYVASLRYSSIRPDLPQLLKEMKQLGVDRFDRCLLTTDGSTPSFYKDGVIDQAIRIAIESGVPLIDAYAMATYNVAMYYQLPELGMIAPGKIAHINILHNKDEPTPKSVIAKGKWLVRHEEEQHVWNEFPWEKYGLKHYNVQWDLTIEDLSFPYNVGLQMVNGVIIKQYERNATEVLQDDEHYFVLADRNGKWLVPTYVKGFAENIGGLASSFSSMGDLILIGKNKSDIVQAFHTLKKQGGGIALVNDGTMIDTLSLPIDGFLSTKPMEWLIQKQTSFVNYVKKHGFMHEDFIYSLLFFTSTHLPFVRVTQRGIYNVMDRKVLFPAIMR